MPIFDVVQQRIVLRIVFDGPPEAGKTTNVLQLHGCFTDRRRGALFQPDERNGRTLFFDWFELDGGLVAGHTLRCQIASVPGQEVLGRRRLRLLREADVVVFVCESSPEGVSAGRTLLRDLRAMLADREFPELVVQANKQDRPGALSPSEVVTQLVPEGEVPVVGAIASQCMGVRETLVLAVRAGANRAQRQVTASGLAGISGTAEAPEKVLADILEDETRSAMARLAQASEAVTPVEENDPLAERGDERPEVAASPVEHEERAEVAPSEQSFVAEDNVRSTPDDAPSVEPEPDRELELRTSSPDPLPIAPPAPAPRFEPIDTEPALPLIPPLPSPELPSVSIWPAGPGRLVLKQLDPSRIRARPDLLSQHGKHDGSGGQDTFVLELDGLCLKTSVRRRFESLDEARTALVHLARKKARLGDLLPPRTVLALAEGERETWLWTITPWATTLRAQMNAAEEAGDTRRLTECLVRFADLAFGAISLALQHGLSIDVHPSNFGTIDGIDTYLDDDISSDGRLPTIGWALLSRFDEYPTFPGALDRYRRAIEERIAERLSKAEIEALGLGEMIEGVIVRTPHAGEAKRKLLGVFSRLAESA